ncbi:hypothetical protein D3C80_1454600 [compost metagenome]
MAGLGNIDLHARENPQAVSLVIMPVVRVHPVQRLIHPEEIRGIKVLCERQRLQAVRQRLRDHFTEVFFRESGFLR